MPLLLKVSWLIPFSPLLVSFLISLLLITFNRTMNRLGRPISYLVITSIGLSTTLSFLLYNNHLSGEVFGWNLNLFSSELHIGIFVDSLSTLVASIIGSIFLAIMIGSYYLMERKKGYVRYLVSISLLFGLLFAFILTNPIFAIN